MKTGPSPSEIVNRPLGRALASIVILLGAAIAHPAKAIMITADFTNLADTLPGQDTWRASYTISGTTFSANQGFSIFFDSSLYSNLSAPVLPVSPTWDALSVQPDVLLSAPGFLDGLALVNSPDLSLPFVLDFSWLGSALPGSQSFEIYDQNSQFQVIGSGQTVVGSIDPGDGGGTNVPDTGTTFVLLGISLSGLLLTKQRLLRRATC
jgi:VPDSG-CTERM motif